MKKSETDREIIDLIKDTLESYEEQYILGSWENFIRRRKRRKKLILWFSGAGIAASLLIGWLGFRFILSGSFSGNADQQQQSQSNLQIPVEKDLFKEHIMIHLDPAIPAENNKIMRHSLDQAFQNTIMPQNKNQTQVEVPDTLNILKTAKVNTSGSNNDTYSSEKSIVKHLPDTVNKGLSTPGGTFNKVSSVSEVHRSDTSGNNPAYGQADIKITPENDLSENRRSQKLRLVSTFHQELHLLIQLFLSTIQAD